MTATRRLAAIMAIDVVGYSRLMGEDEAGTAKAVREHRDAARPLVANRGGRIVKTMGDGLLLEFPSVVDAVECAVAIQRLMVERNAETAESRRIVYRVGVHLGDVLIEGDDILGEGVNIAARLEGLCEPGGVLISGSAHEQVRGRIEADFADLGEKSLKNIARPVRAFRVLTAASTPATRNPPPALPDKPSIAVLAFQNMSGDPEQEYFADGMVDDIISGLSRIKWLFVIARNSSFAYKGRSVDVRQIGRELGVRYVLEGGVRRAGSRVRINTQLLEAETATHLWADKIDGSMEDVFALQDEVADRVVGVIEPNLLLSEIKRSRRRRPENLQAYDLYLRGLHCFRISTAESVAKAAEHFRGALELNPHYADAQASLGWCHYWRFREMGFAEAERAAALGCARAAIAVRGGDANVLATAAPLLVWLAQDYEGAINAVERAIAANPASALAHFYGAMVYAYAGRPDAATAHAHRALRLSPLDPLICAAYEALGLVAMQEARYDEAASYFAKAIQSNPSITPYYVGAAAALELAGRAEAAQAMARQALRENPEINVRAVFKFGLGPAMAAKLAACARRLGIPE